MQYTIISIAIQGERVEVRGKAAGADLIMYLPLSDVDTYKLNQTVTVG